MLEPGELSYAIENHDANLERYNENSERVLERYTTYNKGLIDLYRTLIDDLKHNRENKELSYEYDWKTNLYKK